MFRELNEVKTEKYLKGNSKVNEAFVKIITKNNNYYVTSNEIESISESEINNKNKNQLLIDGLGLNSLWIVVKSLKIFKLSQGDYIKLGRIRFRIKEFCAKPENTIKKIEKIKTFEESDSKGIQKNSELICRICLSDLDDDEDNPFITPCKCAGTMQFIHIRCLQHWIKSKLQIKETYCSLSFIWKNFECELCKNAYPNEIEIKGRKFDIVEIPKPDNPYIILEVLSRDKNQCRGVHVINMGLKNYIKLGRGHDSELRITDISVSRCHAILKFEKGSFFIEDNASKFGTLVLAKNPILINLNNNNIALQVGRTVLYFTAKKQKKILKAFFGNSNNINSNLTNTSEIEFKKREESLGISPIHNKNYIIEDSPIDFSNNLHEDEIENHLDGIAPEEELEREIVSFHRIIH